MTNLDTRGLLNIWWEQDCARRRQSLVPQYPMPHDGASHYLMSNFMTQVGFGDERLGTEKHLNILMFMARVTISAKFLELWPIRPPTVKPVEP